MQASSVRRDRLSLVAAAALAVLGVLLPACSASARPVRQMATGTALNDRPDASNSVLHDSRLRPGVPPTIDELAARVRDVYAKLPFLRFRAEITGPGIPAGVVVEASMSGNGSSSGHLMIDGRSVYAYKAFFRQGPNGTRRECLEVDFIKRCVTRHVQPASDPIDLRLLHCAVAEDRLSPHVSCAFGVAAVSHIGVDAGQREHYAGVVMAQGKVKGGRVIDGERCWVVRGKRFDATFKRPALFDEIAVGAETGLVRYYRTEFQRIWQLRPWLDCDRAFRAMETPGNIPDEVFQSLPPDAADFTEVDCTPNSTEPVCMPTVKAAAAAPAGPRP